MTPHIELADLVATQRVMSPKRLADLLRAQGPEAVGPIAAHVDESTRAEAVLTAERLLSLDVSVVRLDEPDYPAALAALKSPPPLLYLAGNRGLLREAGVGMCGSRSASESGLRAADACGAAVAREGLVVVSGNARGVDLATHLAALNAGGSTILVLPEGILSFKPRRMISSEFDPERVLVISQFRPDDRWHVGNAMARNEIIAGLGRALVVIEAREEGGTLDAGMRALAMGRPVIALQFDTGPMPAGNELLLRHGAIPVSRPSELVDVLSALADDPLVQTGQLELLLRA